MARRLTQETWFLPVHTSPVPDLVLCVQMAAANADVMGYYLIPVADIIQSHIVLRGELFADIQDNEVATARQLIKISPRAAGALVGVIIEGHLQKVADAHGIKIPKKNSTIADLNDPLKAALVLDTAGWRKISFLEDIRNLCSHKKDVEPTKEQVEELIEGAAWVTKNVF